MRTVKAMIDENGVVRLLEPISLPGPHLALVTILEEEKGEQKLRPYGLCAGEFTVPDDFDAPLPDEILTS